MAIDRRRQAAGRGARGGRVAAIENQYEKRDQRNNRVTYLDAAKLEEAGVKAWKSKPGDNFIVILPPPEPDAYFGMKIFAHFDVGPNGGAFLCPREMAKEYGLSASSDNRCPICEDRDRLRKQAEPDQDEMRALNCWPPRFLYLIVDVKDDATIAEGVQLYDAPRSVDNAIVGLCKDPRTGAVIDISDPAEGANGCGVEVRFHRTGKGKTDTRYESFSLGDRREPLEIDYAKLPDIGDLVVLPTYDEILAEYGGAPEPAREPARAAAPVERAPSEASRRPAPSRDAGEVEAVTSDDVPFGEADGAPPVEDQRKEAVERTQRFVRRGR